MKRQPPDVGALLGMLNAHSVRYVVTGSTAALLHGVSLTPGDLDVTPARDRDNLERLARVVRAIDARIDPEDPFGRWQRGEDGEQRWVEYEPSEQERRDRAEWQPDAGDPSSFDHLLQSRYGAFDIVPDICGTYDELVARGVRVDFNGEPVWVQAIHDLLATITVPRREKDRDRVAQLRALQQAQHSGRGVRAPLGV